MKSVLTSGKVALADMMGDDKILAAMRSNEEDTVTAYERAASNDSASPELRTICERAHADELRHRDWMARMLDALSVRA